MFDPDDSQPSKLLADLTPPMAYWGSDLRCRTANRSFEVWCNATPDTLIGKGMRELLGPALFAHSEPHVQRALAGEAQLFERLVPHPDGSSRHTLTRYVPDVAPSGEVRGFVCVVNEITTQSRSSAKLASVAAMLDHEVQRRRGLEQRLVDAEQTMGIILDSIGAGFAATDAHGRVVAMNDMAEQLFGWRRSEAVGQPLFAVYKREDRAREDESRNPIDVMLRAGIELDPGRNVVVVARDGRRTPVAASKGVVRGLDGTVRGLALVLRDRSQQVQAAERTAREDERFRRIVESSPHGVVMVDDTQTIVMVNGRVEQIFGYSRAELLGQSLSMLIPPRFRAAHAAYAAQFQTKPTARAMGEGRDLAGRARDGSEIPLEVQLTQVETTAGRFTMASIADVSKRKAAERELKRSNAELEQFAYVASHDLQEPLRMVASYTELLAKRYHGKLDEKAEKYIYYANDGARRMQQLVRDLLAYSRVGSQGKILTVVSAQKVAQRVVTVMRPAIKSANATLELAPLPEVMADEGQLEQVLQNLIGNALKFRRDEPLRISVAANLVDDRWRFEVKDNGIGIDVQYSDRIFQMFQRLHALGRYEGSGIGLAIVKRIIERHGGRVWFDSTLNQGTTFYFTLAPAPTSD